MAATVGHERGHAECGAGALRGNAAISGATFIEMGAMGAASKPAGRLEVRLELGDGLVLQLVRG